MSTGDFVRTFPTIEGAELRIERHGDRWMGWHTTQDSNVARLVINVVDQDVMDIGRDPDEFAESLVGKRGTRK